MRIRDRNGERVSLGPVQVTLVLLFLCSLDFFLSGSTLLASYFSTDKDIGVTLDSHLSLENHTFNVSRTHSLNAEILPKYESCSPFLMQKCSIMHL